MGNYCVLVVEDDHGLRDVLARGLREADFDVLTAADGVPHPGLPEGRTGRGGTPAEPAAGRLAARRPGQRQHPGPVPAAAAAQAPRRGQLPRHPHGARDRVPLHMIGRLTPSTLRGRLALLALATTALWVALLTVVFNVALGSKLRQQADDLLRTRAAAASATVDIAADGSVTVRDPGNDGALDTGIWIYRGATALERPTAPA